MKRGPLLSESVAGGRGEYKNRSGVATKRGSTQRKRHKALTSLVVAGQNATGRNVTVLKRKCHKALMVTKHKMYKI